MSMWTTLGQVLGNLNWIGFRTLLASLGWTLGGT